MHGSSHDGNINLGDALIGRIYEERKRREAEERELEKKRELRRKNGGGGPGGIIMGPSPFLFTVPLASRASFEGLNL